MLGFWSDKAFPFSSGVVWKPQFNIDFPPPRRSQPAREDGFYDLEPQIFSGRPSDLS
jgi:hypothetical protein